MTEVQTVGGTENWFGDVLFEFRSDHLAQCFLCTREELDARVEAFGFVLCVGSRRYFGSVGCVRWVCDGHVLVEFEDGSGRMHVGGFDVGKFGAADE